MTEITYTVRGVESAVEDVDLMFAGVVLSKELEEMGVQFASLEFDTEEDHE
jgi:hypothetical protein